MRFRFTAVVLLMLAGCAPPATPESQLVDIVADSERPGWADAFRAEGTRGTFVLYHSDTRQTERYNPERAATRYVPASTFKLYNALVAVETGVVRDVDSAFVWDGVERSIRPWNQNHTLRTGMANSVVWLYQRIARDVGRQRYLDTFAHTPYGNGVVGDDIGLFWLDRSLQISADEQVRFVDALRTGDTGFSDATEATVRSIVPVLIERGSARLLAKTGLSDDTGGPQIGWLVGWVERPEADGGAVVFALNAEAESDTTELIPARLRIVDAILTREGVLPPTTE